MASTKLKTKERVKGKKTIYIYLPSKIVVELKNIAKKANKSLSTLAYEIFFAYIGKR